MSEHDPTPICCVCDEYNELLNKDWLCPTCAKEEPMATNQPTTLAECVPILVAAGCPEPPKNLVWSEVDQQFYILSYDLEGNQRGFADDTLVTAALESWVMGVVVPWVSEHNEHECYLFRHHHNGTWFCRIVLDGLTVYESRGVVDRSAAVLALAVAICGVVGEVK